MTPELTKQRLTYEAEKFASFTKQSMRFWDSIDKPEVRVFQDHMQTTMASIMTWKLFTRQLSKHKYPADWVQAFKERWFPKWLKKFFPVKYIEIEIKEIAPLRSRHKGDCRYSLKVWS